MNKFQLPPTNYAGLSEHYLTVRSRREMTIGLVQLAIAAVLVSACYFVSSIIMLLMMGFTSLFFATCADKSFSRWANLKRQKIDDLKARRAPHVHDLL